jgi:hypothetical protein
LYLESRAVRASSAKVKSAEIFRETLKVKERRDDTSKPETESRPARGKGDYYYDDATGYETYDAEDEADEGVPERLSDGNRPPEVIK